MGEESGSHHGSLAPGELSLLGNEQCPEIPFRSQQLHWASRTANAQIPQGKARGSPGAQLPKEAPASSFPLREVASVSWGQEA